MKYLIASGSYKDVYSSFEACKMIESIMPDTIISDICPFCDGGEYTLDTINYYYNCKEHPVDNIINPYLKNVKSKYLSYNNEAYIISSEILRLYPDEDRYKNPMNLTDYGLGQLFLDAYKKGFKKINICLGGTSTVNFGIGFIQSLGADILVNGIKKTTPVLTSDIPYITEILFDPSKYSEADISVICDGTASAIDMEPVSLLKISDIFKNQKSEIIKQLNTSTDNVLKLTNSSKHDTFSGCAGGLYFSLNLLKNVNFQLGTDYFSKLFNIEEKIKNSDIILTGEGRFDAPKWGKTPTKIIELAKKYSKKVIFFCGQIAEEIIDDIPENNTIKNNKNLKSFGIDILITCQNSIKDSYKFNSYNDRIELYKRNTPIIFKKALHEVLTQ